MEYLALLNDSFNVTKNVTTIEISEQVLDRYENLPREYLQFLTHFERITNSSETTWFNSISDFNGTSDNEFKWNEFELLSLEWSEDDKEELVNISKFWNSHIPILLSVKEGYQFLAISLEEEKYGEIVHGKEPLFEETTKICNTFAELVDFIKKQDPESNIF